MREIWQRSLHQQQRTQHINFILPLVVLNRALLNLQIPGDASVVYEDVDLELSCLGVREVVLGCVDYVCWASWRAHIGLDYECGYAVLLGEEVGELGAGLGGGV